MASLWQVEDQAAAGTMGRFYRGILQEGLDPSSALRRARLAVHGARDLRGVGGRVTPVEVESGHPFFWAPFIHMGLPR